MDTDGCIVGESPRRRLSGDGVAGSILSKLAKSGMDSWRSTSVNDGTRGRIGVSGMNGGIEDIRGCWGVEEPVDEVTGTMTDDTDPENAGVSAGTNPSLLWCVRSCSTRLCLWWLWQLHQQKLHFKHGPWTLLICLLSVVALGNLFPQSWHWSIQTFDQRQMVLRKHTRRAIYLVM
jgi:hypothetical protein